MPVCLTCRVFVILYNYLVIIYRLGDGEGGSVVGEKFFGDVLQLVEYPSAPLLLLLFWANKHLLNLN